MSELSVKELMRELSAAADKATAELENDEIRQRLANAEHQLYMAELAKHNLKASRRAQFRKRRAAEKRIAELEREKLATESAALAMRDDMRQVRNELESRQMRVELPESFHPDGDIDAPLALDESEVIEALIKAGITPIAICRQCKRELDLSHRPDGAHYCHPDNESDGIECEVV